MINEIILAIALHGAPSANISDVFTPAYGSVIQRTLSFMNVTPANLNLYLLKGNQLRVDYLDSNDIEQGHVIATLRKEKGLLVIGKIDISWLKVASAPDQAISSYVSAINTSYKTVLDKGLRTKSLSVRVVKDKSDFLVGWSSLPSTIGSTLTVIVDKDYRSVSTILGH